MFKVRTTIALQAATGLLLLCGLLATTTRLPMAVWGAEPRVLTQSRLPSTILKRLTQLPMGPITSWYRALTLWDPDMKFYELYNSQWKESRVEELTNQIVQLYNLTDEERVAGLKVAEENVAKWITAADAWREYVRHQEESMSNLIHELLPDRRLVEVEPDMILSVPMKTTSALKSWMVLESLRTLRTWPGEAVLSTGLRTDLKETDFPVLMTLVYMFDRYYSLIVPPEVTLKFILHSHDGGPWSSRMTGIKMSSAPLVTLIDNDDYLAPMAIRIRSQILREFPDLDYLLGGFHSAAVKKDAQRIDFFDKELFPNSVALHLNRTIEEIMAEVRPHVNYEAFTESFREFNFTKRVSYYLGSIVGIPNLGTQWYRMHEEPYMDLMQRNRERISNLTREGRLPELGFEKYMKSSDRGAFRGLQDNRERQDKEYLQREIDLANEQDWDHRCHNAWSAGRRELYETIPAPIWQWNGEDSAYNFQVYQSRLHGICVGQSFGAYGWWEDMDTLYRDSATTPQPPPNSFQGK